MAQNNDSFLMKDAKRLAATEAGQQLLSLFQAQNPQTLQAAMKQASSGDFDQLKQTLGSLITSPEAQTLLKKLENQANE